MSSPAPLGAADLILPPLVGLVFVALAGLLPEPVRQRGMAVFVAGAGAVYLSSGALGGAEFLFCSVMTVLAYRGLVSYRAIGAAWLLHTGWDIAHHLAGSPILWFAPSSSAQCAICDVVLAGWFFLGAPSWLRRR